HPGVEMTKRRSRGIFYWPTLSNDITRKVLYITELLGGKKFVSCSVVLPALCHLLQVMKVYEDDLAYMVNFEDTIKT
ncbi:hypothetical protein XENOCAPTIV_018024, partial [Xenoophorus captivus]